MIRLRDITRLYALLDTLERRLGGKRVLQHCTGRMNWPARGIYFFFENNEQRIDSGIGPRVVRIGTHALTERSRTTLWNRLSQHRGNQRDRGGNHRGSIFRLLVGTALAGFGNIPLPATWGHGSTASAETRRAEQTHERLVSAAIGSMPFLWLGIDDAPGPNSLRGRIERNTIALLSNFERTLIDAPSRAWLGRNCDRESVCASGLWNQNHIREDYDPGFLDDLAQLIERQAP